MNASIRQPIGLTNVSYSGISDEAGVKLRGLCEGLNGNYSKFCDVNLDVKVDVKSDLGAARRQFECGVREEHRGFYPQPGYEIRRAGESRFFYGQRRGIFIELGGKADNLNLTYHLTPKEDHYGRLRMGTLDAMFRASTSSVVAHCSIIEHDGKGIMITSPMNSGKTTLVAQMINAGINFKMVSEDRAFLTSQGAFSLPLNECIGWVRKSTLQYLGINSDADQNIDFSRYVGVVNGVPNVGRIIIPQLNLNGNYGVEQVSVNPRSVMCDWTLQNLTNEELRSITEAKNGSLEKLPRTGQKIIFSTDASKTAQMLREVLRD